jgi:hypothetical protein
MIIHVDNYANLSFVLDNKNITNFIFENYTVEQGILIPKFNIKNFNLNISHYLIVSYDNDKYFINDLNKHILVIIKNIDDYIRNNVYKIIIKNINGRLGNKLIQLSNAVIFAKAFDINIIEFNFDYLKEKKIILNNNINNKKKIITRYFVTWRDNNYIIFDYDSRLRAYEQDLHIYGKMYNNIIFETIKNNLLFKMINVDEETLVIHIRGDDVRNNEICNSDTIYSPCTILPIDYYKNLLDINYKKYMIVTDDKDLQLIKKIKEYGIEKNKIVEIQSNSIDIDIGIIIGCYNLSIARSTFSILLSFFNKNNKIYYPKEVDVFKNIYTKKDAIPISINRSNN